MLSSMKIRFVTLGILVAAVLVAAPAMAHGHARHSDHCVFQVQKVHVQIEDLGDGVLLTMTSDDEGAVARLQEIAWQQVEREDGERAHDCFFHMADVQVMVKDVYNGIILTITSTDDETTVKLQEMARQLTKKGCRRHGHHESHH